MRELKRIWNWVRNKKNFNTEIMLRLTKESFFYCICNTDSQILTFSLANDRSTLYPLLNFQKSIFLFTPISNLRISENILRKFELDPVKSFGAMSVLVSSF